MPKAFNNKEKSLIRSALLEKGKALFSTYGIRKTGIEDLTQAVGIAQGSFYNFFESKEDLYFEIMEAEEEALRRKLLAHVSACQGKPKDTLRNLLVLAFREIDNHPIIKQLYTHNEYEQLMRKLPQEKLDAHLNRDSDMLLPLIKELQDNGRMMKKDPEIISGMLRSLFLMPLHRKEIGESIFEEVLALLIDVVAKGLSKEELS